MGRVILIASGKGGVGKTTLTANLAVALAQRHRVLAMDCDMEMCNLDIVLGMRRSRVMDGQDLLLDRCGEEQALCRHPDQEKLDLLFAPFRPEVNEEEFYTFLHDFALKKRAEYDYVLLDCPSGIGASLRFLSDPRFEMIVVATPDATSVSDAAKVAAFACRKGIRTIHLVVNRIRSALIRQGAAPNVDDIMDGVSLPLLGLIPEDPRIIASQNVGEPLGPRVKVRRAFENICRRIEGEKVELYCDK